jgi:hypothetical protein
MSVSAAIDRGLRTFEDRTGNRVFTWRGADVACIPQEQVDTYAIGRGGFTGNPGCRLMVRWATWQAADSTLVTMDSDTVTADTSFGGENEGTAAITDEAGGAVQTEGGAKIGYLDTSDGLRRPVAGKRITFRGRDYRIDTAKLSLFGTHVVIELGDVNR